MELRHLDTLLAIAEEGSFTAAADALATVQSNVSQQVRQLEAELGAQLLTRTRHGAIPTECGDRVLDRARRVRRELEALRADLSMLQGLEAGDASFGIVGTASRWVVPRLVAVLRGRAPGIRLRVNEGASERLVSEVLSGELAEAVVTEPVQERRLAIETLLDEALVGVVPEDAPLPDGPVPLDALLAVGLGFVLPPAGNPLRTEVDHAAAALRPAPAGRRGGGGHPARERPRRGGRRVLGAARDRGADRAAGGAHGRAHRCAAAAARADQRPGLGAVARGPCGARVRARPRRRAARGDQPGGAVTGRAPRTLR